MNTPPENTACEDRPRPWWVWKTTRWGGATRVAPFWYWDHWVNIATRIRGWYWVKRGF